MNKRLWIIFGVVVIAVVGIAIYANTANKESSNLDVKDVNWRTIITKDNLPEGTSEADKEMAADIVYGNPNSKVTYIEWKNFQCSACQSLFHTLDDIYKDYKDKVAFSERYLYLSGHPNGLATSVAAEAAAKQGKYYEMHAQLLSNADEWNYATIEDRESIFQKYAKKIGLDIDKWTEDYRNYEKNGIKERLDFKNKLGLEAGLTGTPHIMVNGEKVENKDEAIRKALDKALSEN